MRRLIAELRPSTLDQLGRGAALEALGERTSSGSSIDVEINIDLDFETGRSEGRLLGEIEDTIYRLVQEALNNAVHHSEARRARVDVSEDGESLRVRVSDDGKGFDPSVRTDGFGLTGMRERAELANGSFELRSAPGSGTTILAAIPAVYRKDGKAEKAA
jgi:signal transduction histidine kinase